MRAMPGLLLVSASVALAGSKADPSTWILWRAAPIDFPDIIKPSVRLHLRIRTLPNGDCFMLLVNKDLAKPASARLTVKEGIRYKVTDILEGKERGLLDARRKMAVTAQPGGAVCLKIHRVTR